jgi:hypothetical protein
VSLDKQKKKKSATSDLVFALGTQQSEPVIWVREVLVKDVNGMRLKLRLGMRFT